MVLLLSLHLLSASDSCGAIGASTISSSFGPSSIVSYDELGRIGLFLVGDDDDDDDVVNEFPLRESVLVLGNDKSDGFVAKVLPALKLLASESSAVEKDKDSFRCEYRLFLDLSWLQAKDNVGTSLSSTYLDAWFRLFLYCQQNWR